jgi:hypothetical protein
MILPGIASGQLVGSEDNLNDLDEALQHSETYESLSRDAAPRIRSGSMSHVMSTLFNETGSSFNLAELPWRRSEKFEP